MHDPSTLDEKIIMGYTLTLMIILTQTQHQYNITIFSKRIGCATVFSFSLSSIRHTNICIIVNFKVSRKNYYNEAILHLHL